MRGPRHGVPSGITYTREGRRAHRDGQIASAKFAGSRRELAEELAPDDGDDIDDEQAIGRLLRLNVYNRDENRGLFRSPPALNPTHLIRHNKTTRTNVERGQIGDAIQPTLSSCCY
jgi:hypothetical protein